MDLKAAARHTYERLTWTWNPASEKEAGDAIVKNILLHAFPHKVSRRSLSYSYSMYLGTISFVLFLNLVWTGLILMFVYVPSVERAYSSVKDIEYVVAFGWLLRSLHRISAHLMVAAVFLHMVRVFVTGSYKNGPSVGANRPLNWIIGVGLLVLTLLLSFTGYLLPWDQLAYWAITVGTNIASAAPLIGAKVRFLLLGGSVIDQNALIRFYVLHVFFLPLLVFLLFFWHMWRIRKDGGLAASDRDALSARPGPSAPVRSKTYSLLGVTNGASVHVQTTMVNDEETTVASLPHLARRLWLAALGTTIVSFVLAMLFRAPLEAAANPAVTPNPAKAPWYFLWLQEIVTVSTIPLGSMTVNGALIGGILLPGLLIVLALWWPYRDRSGLECVGVWFPPERRWQNRVFLLICLLIIVFTLVGTFLRGPYWHLYMPWESWPTMPVHY